MTNSNTSEDFLRYAMSHGHTKKSSKALLRILKEFCEASISNNQDFLIRGLVKFEIHDTTTTLKP